MGWSHLRKREVQDLSLAELYVFGVVVHAVMILCMFLLPRDVIPNALVKMGIPVMIVYPIGTALPGRLMASRHARRRAEEALRASEENYRELVENANSILIRLDRAGNIRFINEYGISFLGFTQEELLGMPMLGTSVRGRHPDP
jgi:PAS domain-containing protein